MTGAGVSEGYVYDENGGRLRKTNLLSPYNYTSYFFPGYEQTSAGLATRHYTFGGVAVAVRVGAGAPSFLYGDGVQSTVYTTDLAGNVTSARGYRVFGATRFSEGTMPTDRHFTGQQEDATGIYYFNSRYYDPQLGQFLSPDTIVPDPTLLIDYNRYLMTRGNPVRYSDPSGHYSIDELQQHFGVNSFDELMALFGEGGRYEGNSGWYDILRSAQDGDRITAYLPNPTISLSGSFMRNSEGLIQIDMGGGSIVPEYVFADFGSHRTGMTYQGRPAEYGMYYLEGMRGGRRATATSGTQAILDTYGPCRTWDCQAISYDVAGMGGNMLYGASLAGELPSGGLSTAGVYGGYFIGQAASAAGLYHTMEGLSTGETSTIDLAIANVSVMAAPFPVIGAAVEFGQLVWDLIDPIVPE